MTEKQKRLGELAELVAGELSGDPDLLLSGLVDFDRAEPGTISFVVDAKRAERIAECRASALIVPLDLKGSPIPLIRVKNPYLAAARIHSLFIDEPFVAKGIDPRAVIGSGCSIADEVTISPLVAIGDRVRIGSRVRLHPGVVLYDDVIIGDDVVLHANVTVYQGCRVGSRVVIHAGAVIGSDGFGYATDERGCHVKRPQVGTVEIEDDVEIGANTCVDRATFGRTLIGRGTKIDNLVQLGHNVEIGADSLLVAQVGVAGSVSTGRGVVLGGQVGVAGHVHLGERSMVAGKSGVHSDLQPGSVVAGIPAIPRESWLRASIAFAKLPELVRDLRTMKRQLAGSSPADEASGELKQNDLQGEKR